MYTSQELWELIESSNKEQFSRLVDEDPDLPDAATGEYDEQALHYAAWQDRADVVLILVEAGASIDAPGDQGRTPLHYSALEGCLEAAGALIALGADLDRLDDSGFSAAFYGVRGREPKSAEVAQMIVQSGANVDLNLAVCMHDAHRIEEIMREDPSAVGHSRFPNDLVLDAVSAIHEHIEDELPLEGATPAQTLAAMKRHDKALKMLLAGSAPLDTPEFGWPPLFGSCQMRHPYITELLLQNGADPNVTWQGQDVSSVLFCSPCPDKMLNALKRHGFHENSD